MTLTRRGVGQEEVVDRQEYLNFDVNSCLKTSSSSSSQESPPSSGLYFYNPEGLISEPLFAAIMRVLEFSPPSKTTGLQYFQQRGWALVGATYEPVNKLSSPTRDEVIIRDYPLLRDDLVSLMPNRDAPVALIKTNVRRLLEAKLKEDGFNVLNRGRPIYFPSHGNQRKFHEQIIGVLSSWSSA